MDIIETHLAGLKVLIPQIHGDDRGFFKEIIHPKVLTDGGINHRFVQLNHSRSQAGILRGLHFQSPPYAQAKLVRCLRGKIYDVAVDVRPKSSTFGQSYGVELTEENHKMLYVPIGFAHGFYAVTDCDVEYACGDIYAKDFEQVIHWNDDALGINWPISKTPICSQKDASAKRLNDIKHQLDWPNDAYSS